MKNIHEKLNEKHNDPNKSWITPLIATFMEDDDLDIENVKLISKMLLLAGADPYIQSSDSKNAFIHA